MEQQLSGACERAAPRWSSAPLTAPSKAHQRDCRGFYEGTSLQVASEVGMLSG